MFGYMAYFTSPRQPREDRKVNRTQPNDDVRLWGHGRPQRSFGKF